MIWPFKRKPKKTPQAAVLVPTPGWPGPRGAEQSAPVRIVDRDAEVAVPVRGHHELKAVGITVTTTTKPTE